MAPRAPAPTPSSPASAVWYREKASASRAPPGRPGWPSAAATIIGVTHDPVAGGHPRHRAAHHLARGTHPLGHGLEVAEAAVRLRGRAEGLVGVPAACDRRPCRSGE